MIQCFCISFQCICLNCILSVFIGDSLLLGTCGVCIISMFLLSVLFELYSISIYSLLLCTCDVCIISMFLLSVLFELYSISIYSCYCYLVLVVYASFQCFCYLYCLNCILSVFIADSLLLGTCGVCIISMFLLSVLFELYSISIYS